MSIYLILLSFFNFYFDDDKLSEKSVWQDGVVCQVMGTIMTLSIILTTESMLIIIIERYEVITNPFQNKKLVKYSNKISIFLLLFALCISCIPFIYFFFF